MISLNIQDNIVKIPSELDEINLEKGIQIMSALELEPKPSLGTKMSIISLMSNIDVISISNWEDESIEKVYKLLPFQRKDIQIRHWDTLVLKGTLYGMKSLDNITVKEMAQIDFYLNEGETAYDNLGGIIATLLRPVTNKNKSYKHILKNTVSKLLIGPVSPRVYNSYEIEDLKDEHEVNSELFLKYLDFNFGYSIINMINVFKNKMVKSYPIIFREIEETDEEVEEESNTMELEDIWTWYHYVASVSENKFERDAWWEDKLTHFYKYMCYLKQQNAYNARKNG